MLIEKMLTEREATKFLESRGYVVRHARESARVISWSRTKPFPQCHSFQDEALLMIRRQLSTSDIHFSKDTGPLDIEINTAMLRLL